MAYSKDTKSKSRYRARQLEKRQKKIDKKGRKIEKKALKKITAYFKALGIPTKLKVGAVFKPLTKGILSKKRIPLTMSMLKKREKILKIVINMLYMDFDSYCTQLRNKYLYKYLSKKMIKLLFMLQHEKQRQHWIEMERQKKERENIIAKNNYRNRIKSGRSVHRPKEAKFIINELLGSGISVGTK